MGLKFSVQVAEVCERETLEGDSPEDFVLDNASRKGEGVARFHPQSLVLAADTTVFFNSRIFNKPASLEEAHSMLEHLSGQTHEVWTGVVLLHKEHSWEDRAAVCSRVTFKELSPATREAYFQKMDPLDKAGGYGIQEGRDLILQGLEGSFSNVMGLPCEWLEVRLKALNLLDLFQEKPVS